MDSFRARVDREYDKYLRKILAKCLEGTGYEGMFIDKYSYAGRYDNPTYYRVYVISTRLVNGKAEVVVNVERYNEVKMRVDREIQIANILEN